MWMLKINTPSIIICKCDVCIFTSLKFHHFCLQIQSRIAITDRNTMHPTMQYFGIPRYTEKFRR